MGLPCIYKPLTTPSAPHAEQTVTSHRVLSVDVLRGLCVAGMVLVNFPGDWILRYPQLAHADWDGATATDMIFPLFLFLSGFSMVYSFASRTRRGATKATLAGHVVLRSVELLVLGLALNAFPTFDWHMLHVFGVLQRIALCYFVGGLLVLWAQRSPAEFHVNLSVVISCSVFLLLAVWAVQRFLQVPGYGTWRFDQEGNIGAVIDRAIFGNRHMSDWGGPARMWDADGLLSCITSIPNMLLGVLSAEWIRRSTSVRKATGGMALVAGLLVAAALLLKPYFVINRKLWTDTFMLLSGGISLGVFALSYWWLDGAHPERPRSKPAPWLTPALIYGSNAILGFALYVLVLGFHGLCPLPGAHQPANWMPGSAYTALSASVGAYNASLLYGLLAVLLVMGLLWPLYRKKIFLKL